MKPTESAPGTVLAQASAVEGLVQEIAPPLNVLAEELREPSPQISFQVFELAVQLTPHTPPELATLVNALDGFPLHPELAHNGTRLTPDPARWLARMTTLLAVASQPRDSKLRKLAISTARSLLIPLYELACDQGW